jgi:hypothetical protein
LNIFFILNRACEVHIVAVENWRAFLKHDPLPALRGIKNPVIQYFIHRDIIGKNPGPVESLWSLPEATRILEKQLPSGAWPDKRKAAHATSATNYLQVETYRNLAVLIEAFGFNMRHLAVEKAVEYLFSTRSPEGDFRGVYGVQYSPNYCGAILELVVKAGYADDARVHEVFTWLIKNQQAGGGWTLPMQTHDVKSTESEPAMAALEPLPFDHEMPFAHMVTGIVLRAFAAHPTYQSHPAALAAGNLVTSRFFRDDVYTSRKDASYWTKYSFPFWWTDLISSLDALSRMGFSMANPGIRKALNHFRDDQQPEGTWIFSVLKNKSMPDLDAWLNYTLCKILKRFLA